MSIKSKIKSECPLLYQLYKILTDIKDAQKIKSAENKFYSLADWQIRQLDSELYFKAQGKVLDWNHLLTYTEKMQWAKLYDKDPRKVILSDKYAVRAWVSETIGEEYLIPLIGVWDKYEDINFKVLPEQFVMKTNHGSNDVVIVRSKSKLSLAQKIEMRRKITNSLKRDYGSIYCELHYGKIPAKIIAEKFLDSGETDLQDYKFLCFSGKPYFCWVDIGRYTKHKRNVYDLNWNLQDWNQFTYGNTEYEIEKPKNFDQMIGLAEKLSRGFSHVRVDLYNIDGKIYFGEMTFTNGSGFEKIIPPSADLMLGNLWDIDPKSNSEDSTKKLERDTK